MVSNTVLTFRSFEGPLLQIFQDPDTGRKFTAKTRAELLTKVINYRIQNKLETLAALNQTISHYQCNLPENVGKCQEYALKRGLMQTLKGGISILQNIWYNRTVPQVEAERRAKICEKCPYNSFPDKDSFTKWSDEMALNMVGDKKVSIHEKLGNCEICTCVLKAKVFYSGKVSLTKEQVDAMTPVKCWQLQIQE